MNALLDTPVPVTAPTSRAPQSQSGRALPGAVKLAVFFLFLGCCAIAIDAAITHGLRKVATSNFGTFNRVMNGQVNAEILITGSSRAVAHYDPRIIEQATGRTAFNIGLNASQIDFELAMLRTYLKHNHAPVVVIQNLDLFSFEVTQPGSVYRPGYYVPYLYEDELYSFLHGIDFNAWKWKYIPLYAYAVEDMRFTWVKGLLGCLGVNGREDTFSGFNPRDQVWNEDFEHFRAQVKDTGIRHKITPEGLNALETIINTCQNRGIRLILVYSPEYYEAQALETNRREIMEKFAEVARQHSIAFWDFSESILCRDKALFQNSQHLNRNGAAAFTSDLSKRLLNELRQAGPAAEAFRRRPN